MPRVFPFFGAPRRTLACGVAVVALALLSACGSRTEWQSRELGEYCQLKPCICEEADASILSIPETAPLQWTPDGTAYCQPGFGLRPAPDA